MCPCSVSMSCKPPGVEKSARVIPKEMLTARGQRSAPALSRQKCSLFLQLASEGSTRSSALSLSQHHTYTHKHATHACTHRLTSSLASLRESSTSEKLKLASVTNWLTTDTNLSPTSCGRFFWKSNSCT